jgi:hypothetical protein
MRRTGDHAMTSTTTKPDAVQPDAGTAAYLFDDWFDPIEAGLRDRVRGFIETTIRTELDATLARPRYARRPEASRRSGAGRCSREVGTDLLSVTTIPALRDRNRRSRRE